MKTALPLTHETKSGAFFVKEGLVMPSDVNKVLAIQEKGKASAIWGRHRFLGTLLCSLNLITPVDNFYILHHYNKHLTIKTFLDRSKGIPQDELNLAIKRSNSPLISLLIEKKIIPLDEMRQIVFSLYHIPLRSIDTFRFNTVKRKKLSSLVGKEQAWKMKAIPLVIQDNTVLIAITDPANLLFIRELNVNYLHYRFKTVFILISDFNKLFDQLYGFTPKLPVPKSSIRRIKATGAKPDLSLLFGFRIVISDPNDETDDIEALYRRYELLRKLTFNQNRDNKSGEFKKYIGIMIEKLKASYRVKKIEIHLKNRAGGVSIVAVPRQ